MKHYNPKTALKVLVGIVAVGAALVIIPELRANPMPKAFVNTEAVIAETANCLVLTRNTDMEMSARQGIANHYSGVLDALNNEQYAPLVIKYVSRSEGFLVGAAFGRYGEKAKDMTNREALTTIANELFVKYCAAKA